MSEPAHGPVTLRAAAAGDIAAIRAVSLAAGQPETDSGADADYVRLLLATGAVAVAVDAAQTAIGWGATKPCSQGSLLSDLFVDPARHGQGMGARLLQLLWPDAPEGPRRFTFSSQHRNALPLYARAGLSPAWPLLYLSGSSARLPDSRLLASRISHQQAAAADAELAGADRGSDYGYWERQPDATAMVVHDGDRVVAAGAATPDRLIHLACPRGQDAATALLAALSLLPGTPVSVCLPGPHPGFVALLRAGFRIEDFDLAMLTLDVDLPTSWAYAPGLG